jgi:hypothetical protein
MARKSQTQFDPTRNPFSGPAPRYGYLKHPTTGKNMMVNNDTLVIMPVPDEAPYPDVPTRLPERLMQVDQPNIRTCGMPKRDGSTLINAGCLAAEGGGCPIYQQYGRVGPVNVIAEKNGHPDSLPCHLFYCGRTPTGRPTSQAHYQLDGFNILTDRTTIPENVAEIDPVTGRKIREYVRETEVPDLAPFYEEAKVGRFAKPKRKNVHRESLPAA